MVRGDLLEKRRNVFSQNGEDGIIAEIFRYIGTESRVCCEFGAWDGIHLSNCRNLIMQGWKAIMIEGDLDKYKDLVANYANDGLVACINTYIDCETNSINSVVRANTGGGLDFLSIDIDGLDYEIFENLDLTPRLICIEVNAGHAPDSGAEIDRVIAKNNVGQSLKYFDDIASRKGYGLVCYNGNAFFVRNDLLAASRLEVLTAQEAYESFLEHLDVLGKEWLYLVNKGLVEPFHRYSNRYLSRTNLGISVVKSIELCCKPVFRRYFTGTAR